MFYCGKLKCGEMWHFKESLVGNIALPESFQTFSFL